MKEKKDMNNLAVKQENEHIRYTYDDILQFTDEKRYEIIDGFLYLMESPSLVHQGLSGEILYQIKNYLKGKKCKVFAAPLDVKISGEKDNKKAYNVVQPDIVVVCDDAKLEKGCICGAPDLAIEILSPSTKGKDRLQKFNLYQKYGVKEYWIVAPDEKCITVFILNDKGIYTIPKAYELTEKIKVNITKGLYISLKDYYEENKKLFEEE